MTTPLSDTRLTEIRDCHQAATGGRWLIDRDGAFGETTVIADQGEHAATIGSMDFGDGDQADADRTFVLYAHRDVGVLLAEVDRLRAESEQRLGELLFWHTEFREAMDNYHGEAAHAKKLRAELESALVLDRAALELLMDLLTADRYRMDRGDGIVPQPRWATNVRTTAAVHAALDQEA